MANIPGGFAQCNLVFSGTGLPRGAEVTFGLDVSGFSPPATSAAITVIAVWQANLMAVTPAMITLDRVKMRYGPVPDGAAVEAIAGLPGTFDASDVVPNVSLLIKKMSDQGGRRNRGRMYYPANETYSANGGMVRNDQISPLQDAFSAFLSNLVTEALPMVILHNSGPDTPTAVRALALVAQLASQRRRLRGS